MKRLDNTVEMSRSQDTANLCLERHADFKISGDCKMEKPALELVLQALDALYRKEDPTEKEKASQWLMQLQASVSSLCGLISAHQSCRGPYRTHTIVHTEL